MPSQQARLQMLLSENPQLAVLAAELLGPPLGLRMMGSSGESSSGS